MATKSVSQLKKEAAKYGYTYEQYLKAIDAKSKSPFKGSRYGYFVKIDGEGYPVAPSSIETKIPNKNDTVTLINGGERTVIKNAGLTEITMTLLIPSTKWYSFSRANPSSLQNIVHWHKPEYYIKKLSKLKTSGKVFKLWVNRCHSGMYEAMQKTLPITSWNVTLETMTIIEDREKYGMDVAVDLKFKEYVAFVTKKIKKVSSSSSSTKTSTSSKTTTKKYTIKKDNCKLFVNTTNNHTNAKLISGGISLTKIAKSSKWGKGNVTAKELYQLNKTVLDKVAKSQKLKGTVKGLSGSHSGKYLFKGTTIKVPIK